MATFQNGVFGKEKLGLSCDSLGPHGRKLFVFLWQTLRILRAKAYTEIKCHKCPGFLQKGGPETAPQQGIVRSATLRGLQFPLQQLDEVSKANK